MYGQPAIAGGRLFVGSDNAVVYALNAETGCVYWSFQAGAAVRTAISVGAITGQPGARYAVYFGDLNGAVYAVNAETGTLLWKQQADPHPVARITGAPTLYRGRLYVPGHRARGERGHPIRNMNAARSRAPSSRTTRIPARRSGEHRSSRSRWPARRRRPSAPNCGDRQVRASGRRRPSMNARTACTWRRATHSPRRRRQRATRSSPSISTRAVRRWVKQMTPDDAYIYGCGGAKQSETCPTQPGP